MIYWLASKNFFLFLNKLSGFYTRLFCRLFWGQIVAIEIQWNIKAEIFPLQLHYWRNYKCNKIREKNKREQGSDRWERSPALKAHKLVHSKYILKSLPSFWFSLSTLFSINSRISFIFDDCWLGVHFFFIYDLHWICTDFQRRENTACWCVRKCLKDSNSARVVGFAVVLPGQHVVVPGISSTWTKDFKRNINSIR